MKIQANTRFGSAFATLRTVLVIATLVGGGSHFTLHGAGREEDKAKGESLLKKSREDLVEAQRLEGLAIKLANAATRDQANARLKRQEAQNMAREGYRLIGDTKRSRAMELRAQAEAKETLARSDEAQIVHLQSMQAHYKKVAADASSAAAKVEDAARNEPNAAEKAELKKMAETLTAQSTEATTEAATCESRIKLYQGVVNRFLQAAKALNSEADVLAPVEK